MTAEVDCTEPRVLEILLILDILLQTAEGKRTPDDSVSDICSLRSPERKIGQEQVLLPYRGDTLTAYAIDIKVFQT